MWPPDLTKRENTLLCPKFSVSFDFSLGIFCHDRGDSLESSHDFFSTINDLTSR